jgi:eukaryotic-like serine/threonine-protein kinase
MIAVKLDRKNRLVTELLDHCIMTGIVMVLAAPVIIMRIANSSAPDMHISLYEVFCFSLYFNKDVFLGRSIAKRILGFQVLNNKTRSPAGPLRCLIRNLTIFLWPVEVIVSLANVNRRIGDHIAGTRLEVYDPRVPARPNWGTIIASLPLAMGLLWVCWLGPMDWWINSIAGLRVRDIHADSREAGTVAWRYQTGGKVFSSPVLYKDLVIVGSEDKKVYALHSSTGKVLWEFATGGPVDGSAVVMGDKVFIGSYDGKLYALDVHTGQLQWTFRTGGERRAGAKGLWTMKPVTEYMEDPFDFFLSSATADPVGGLVYFGSGDGNLYALSSADGSLKWRFQTGGIIHTSPVLRGNTLYFGSWDRSLYAVDSRTGQLKWKFETRADSTNHLLEGIQASPLVYNDRVYFGARDGYFYALDAVTGKPVWTYSANSSWILTTAAADDGVIYFGTSDTYLLVAVDATNGKEKFRAKANGYVYSSAVVDSNSVYFGDFSGQLLTVDKFSGKVVNRWRTPGRAENGSTVLKRDTLDFAYMTRGMDLAEYATTVVGMRRLYTLGPIVGKPALGKRVVYFGSADSCIYAVHL